MWADVRISCEDFLEKLERSLKSQMWMSPLLSVYKNIQLFPNWLNDALEIAAELSAPVLGPFSKILKVVVRFVVPRFQRQMLLISAVRKFSLSTLKDSLWMFTSDPFLNKCCNLAWLSSSPSTVLFFGMVIPRPRLKLREADSNFLGLFY